MEFKRNAKHDAEAEAAGLEIIGKGKNYNYRLYRFKECGHEQELTISQVRTRNFKCHTCFPAKDLHKEAEAAGLELIGKGKNRDYRLYRFKECGHEQQIQVGDVRSCSVKCGECLVIKHNQEAEAAGLELIGKSNKGYHFRKYRCMGCSKEQDIRLGAVRKGSFLCVNCGISSSGFDATKAGTCYLYRWEHPETKHSFLKFGITNRDVEIRINEQARKTAYKPSQLVAIPYPTGDTAKALESALDAFQSANGGQYMKKEDFEQGFTETVSIEHEQSVKDLISEYCFGLIGLV